MTSPSNRKGDMEYTRDNVTVRSVEYTFGWEANPSPSNFQLSVTFVGSPYNEAFHNDLSQFLLDWIDTYSSQDDGAGHQGLRVVRAGSDYETLLPAPNGSEEPPVGGPSEP